MLAAPFAGAPAAFAADDPDASFYKKAAEAGLFEVDAANQAEQKANSQKIKDFAAEMVKDHSAANDKLASIAQSKNITLPTSASMGQMAVKAKLDVLSGDTYDKSYIKSQIKAHRQAIALFKNEIATGQDPDAKAFAAATLPTLRAHLKAIRTVAADSGMTAGATADSGGAQSGASMHQ
jgi:putative membrane protein